MRTAAYLEKRPHGTADFPAEYHYVDKTHPQYVMPYHWHKEWELIQVKQGSFNVRANDAEITAVKGDVILIRDGMLHGGEPDDSIYECFLFDLRELFLNAEIFKRHLKPFYGTELVPHVFFPAKKFPEISEAVARLNGYCTFSDNTGVQHDQLMILGSLCNIFGLILRDHLYTVSGADGAAPMTHHIDSIKAVIDLVEREYASPLTLSRLAQCANMNANYFCRVFREVIHCTPMEYVLRYRLEQAAAALSASGVSVAAAAAQCGFNDYSYFIRAFHSYMGITPKQYQMRGLSRRVV